MGGLGRGGGSFAAPLIAFDSGGGELTVGCWFGLASSVSGRTSSAVWYSTSTGVAYEGILLGIDDILGGTSGGVVDSFGEVASVVATDEDGLRGAALGIMF